jgi:hypothetical protein
MDFAPEVFFLKPSLYLAWPINLVNNFSAFFAKQTFSGSVGSGAVGGNE